jgi:hypothetical protein
MQAGWHPDPTGRFKGRYHDGTDWTGNVSDGGDTLSDPLPPEAERPLWIRSTCPTCGHREIRFDSIDALPALICLRCAGVHPFVDASGLASHRTAYEQGDIGLSPFWLDRNAAQARKDSGR